MWRCRLAGYVVELSYLGRSSGFDIGRKRLYDSKSMNISRFVENFPFSELCLELLGAIVSD